MKALVWDDKFDGQGQQDYMSMLRQQLLEITNGEVDLAIHSDPNAFLSDLKSGKPYDFFITDWFDQRQAIALTEPRGQLLVGSIRRVFPTAPIFVVSEFNGRIDESLLLNARPLFVKSKRSYIPWLADDIVETLRDFGLLVDSRKVFLIYGHDRHADGARDQVRKFLRGRGIEPVLMESRHSREGILPDLLREMRTCAAFIAICTPDDLATEGLNPAKSWCQPRQNVLFEIGIVYGLAQGARRLTILQKWVDGDATDCAVLPSDWGGYLSIHFSNSIVHTFEQLGDRLTQLGVPTIPAA